MYLTAFLHRDELFEITNRWVSDRLRPEDPLQITRIISYDSFVAWETLLSFADDLLKSYTTSHVKRTPVRYKRELKDYISNAGLQGSDSIRALVKEYQKSPEFYYADSPITGFIYHDSSQHIRGMCRLKRVKRIAEKASRYASLYISHKLQTIARTLSDNKTDDPAHEKDIPTELFVKAEERLMNDIRKHGIGLPFQPIIIRDILGVKLIDDGNGEERLESIIDAYNGALIVDKERHEGNYNAVHYVAKLKVDIEKVIDKFNAVDDYSVYIRRGLNAETLKEDFAELITTGHSTVQSDLIFTSLEELIESEIGRSMHEKRIFEQRRQKDFNCNILSNLEYIIEYLLAVGMSPAVHIDEIPIKIWGRYLPDALGYEIRKLYNMPEYSLV